LLRHLFSVPKPLGTRFASHFAAVGLYFGVADQSPSEQASAALAVESQLQLLSTAAVRATYQGHSEDTEPIAIPFAGKVAHQVARPYAIGEASFHSCQCNVPQQHWVKSGLQ